VKARRYTTTVGDIATVNAGNSAPQKKELFAGGRYPFFRTSDAGRIRFGDIFEATDYLNGDGITGLRKFPKGTILFPKSGASTFLNHRVMLGVDGFVSSHLAAIVGDESKVDRRFLLYFLSTVSAQDLVQDHAYPSLKLPEIAKVPIALPSLDEQRRIVGILDEAFEGIAKAVANAEANLNNARELFESHLNAVFSNPGPDWTEKKLEQLCEVKHGFAFKSKSFAKDNDEKKPIIITPGNFTEEGGLAFTDKNTKRFIGEAPKEYLFSLGELVIVMTDLSSKMKILGKPAFIDRENILHNQRIGRIVFKEKIVTKEFLYYFMRSRKFINNVKQSATGTMVKHTAPKRILGNSIPFPSVEAQQAIVTTLDKLAAETKRLEVVYRQKLALLAELRQSLLHKAFSGGL
jgi:type I restriction enzyme, S subunit